MSCSREPAEKTERQGAAADIFILGELQRSEGRCKCSNSDPVYSNSVRHAESSWSAACNGTSAQCVPVTALSASCSVIVEQFGGFSLITPCALICCSVSVAGSDKAQSAMNCSAYILHSQLWVLWVQWNKTKHLHHPWWFLLLIKASPDSSYHSGCSPMLSLHLFLHLWAPSHLSLSHLLLTLLYRKWQQCQRLNILIIVYANKKRLFILLLETVI